MRVPIFVGGRFERPVGTGVIDSDRRTITFTITEERLVLEIEELFTLDQILGINIGVEYRLAAPTLRED